MGLERDAKKQFSLRWDIEEQLTGIHQLLDRNIFPERLAEQFETRIGELVREIFLIAEIYGEDNQPGNDGGVRNVWKLGERVEGIMLVLGAVGDKDAGNYELTHPNTSLLKGKYPNLIDRLFRRSSS